MKKGSKNQAERCNNKCVRNRETENELTLA